jgi:hypothetical protein
VFAVTATFRWPTSSPIRAHGTPRRCSSEIRRWRRSWGENAGTPAAVQRAIAVRKRSPPKPGNTRRWGVRSSRVRAPGRPRRSAAARAPSARVRSSRRPGRRASVRAARRRRPRQAARARPGASRSRRGRAAAAGTGSGAARGRRARARPRAARSPAAAHAAAGYARRFTRPLRGRTPARREAALWQLRTEEVVRETSTLVFRSENEWWEWIWSHEHQWHA